jgi:hypothetical protein
LNSELHGRYARDEQRAPGCSATFNLHSRTRISCHATPDEAACAPFSKERRMKPAKAELQAPFSETKIPVSPSPQQNYGCPTSRSFFARCGIPRRSTGRFSALPARNMKVCVSHISRKTSEIWGTRWFVAGTDPQTIPFSCPRGSAKPVANFTERRARGSRQCSVAGNPGSLRSG